MKNKIITIAIFILSSFLVSPSLGQVSPPSWSLKGSYVYMNMKMNDYNNYAMYHDAMAIKTLNTAFGGTIELRRHLCRRFYAGIETGIVSAGVESRSNRQEPANSMNLEYRIKLSLTSVPVNFNLYYSLINRENLNIYSGFSPGIWFNKITLLQSTDYIYTDGAGQGFGFARNVLSAQNFSYCFQLGSEYRVFRKLGIDLKISYRSANFDGFRGDRSRRWIDVDKVRDTIVFSKGSDKVKLTYSPLDKYFGTESIKYTVGDDAHMNMGNWGIALGLMWFL